MSTVLFVSCICLVCLMGLLIYTMIRAMYLEQSWGLKKFISKLCELFFTKRKDREEK